ncbi:hypothetical protein DSO57_1012660 [Entomophthora muscae]|uniref:Uncharacterized protein n=1 Tax=Entomophthora muscae TaxID=34485 RepID=A0ACC2RX79_9FUNG|nr:hypothetical protein DSO57_1012660 [Entomophthora muscae]
MFSSPAPDPNNLAFLSIQLYLLISLHKTNNPFTGVLGSLFEEHELPVTFEPSRVYYVLIGSIEDETTSLILYLLMIHNDSFKEYIFSLTDPSELILPLLKFMYECTPNCENKYQQQLISATFLMCMGGEELIKNLQKKMIQPFPWFQGRLFHQLPLSEFVIHVLLKIITSNLSEPRDQYMYSMCLSSLINMSHYISDIQALLAQKIFALIEYVNKKLIKLGQSNSFEREVKLQGISIYEELLFLLMEFVLINVKLRTNGSTQLVYALLQYKEFLAQFVSHPSLGNIMATSIEVVKYFEKCISDADLSVHPSIEELSDLIFREVLTWQPDILENVCCHQFMYTSDLDLRDYFKAILWVSISTRITSSLDSESLYESVMKQWGY